MRAKTIFFIAITAALINCFEPFQALKAQKDTVRQTGLKPSVAGYTSITSNNLASMLEKKDFFLVNVHIPYEGEIKSTDAFIQYDKMRENLDKLPGNKNAKIVLYCRSGRMSEMAARELVKIGYTNVSHLSGGMIDWQKNGYKVIKK